MRLRSCLHPRKVTHHGYTEYVPCGKCDICRSTRNIQWSERIRLESQEHKYCIFGTLTYADMFLPRMIPVDKGFVVHNNDPFYPDRVDDGLFFNMPYQSDKVKKFVELQMRDYGFIPFLSRYDAQTFFKRVRRYIDYHFCKNLSKDEKKEFRISYALCGEYGPSTWRPHFHFNLFFDSPRLARSIKQILRSCWPHGSSSYRWSSDKNSARYVAQYVNSVHRLPDVLKIKDVCPFLLVSKRQPMASSKVSKEEIQRIIKSGSPTVSLYDAEKGSFVELPLWKSLENRCFPKFSGFNFLPDRLSARLVGLAAESHDLKEFINIALSYRDGSFFKDANIQVSDYFNVMLKDAGSLSRDPLLSPDQLSDKIFVSVCRSVYYCSKRIYRNMLDLGMTDYLDYIRLIEKYDLNRSNYNFRKMYEFFNTIPESSRCYFDMSLACPDSDPVFSMEFGQIMKSIEISHKNRRKNDYLNSHPELKVRREYDEFLEGIV